jgi:hypothetical protein
VLRLGEATPSYDAETEARALQLFRAAGSGN